MSNTLRVIFCCRGFDTGMYVAARLGVTEATSFASPAITRMLLILIGLSVYCRLLGVCM